MAGQKKNGHYTPEGFSGPAFPDDIFHEDLHIDTVEDHNRQQYEVFTLDDPEEGGSEGPWSDDSDR